MVKARRTNMTLSPTEDRLIVRPVQMEDVSKGGIIIPHQAKERPFKGEVLAVGPGRESEAGKTIKPKIKAGQFIIFTKYTGAEIPIEDGSVLIMRETDALAVVDE